MDRHVDATERAGEIQVVRRIEYRVAPEHDQGLDLSVPRGLRELDESLGNKEV